MEKISEMIKPMCPEGIKKVRLDSVCTFQRGKTITAKDAIEGIIPVIAGGQTPSYYHNEANRIGESVTIAGSGAYAGFVSYWNTPIYVSDAFTVEPQECLLHKYLYQYLKQNQQKIFDTQKGAGVPHVHGKDIANFDIPLPPLPIQQEIVRILDSFTSMITNLETELASRQKQYEYYRNELLSFDENAEGVEWKTLGEIGVVVRGNGLQKTDFSEEGVGCVHYGQIYTRLGFSIDKTLTFVPEELAEKLTQVEPGNLIIACTSENVEDVCKSVVWLGTETIVTGGHACVYRHNENPKYVGYCFLTNDFFNQKKKYAYGAKVIDIKTEKLALIKIPVPKRSLQDIIVKKLDNFEAIISNIKQELDARKKQYEYYREQLLTFE